MCPDSTAAVPVLPEISITRPVLDYNPEQEPADCGVFRNQPVRDSTGPSTGRLEPQPAGLAGAGAGAGAAGWAAGFFDLEAFFFGDFLAAGCFAFFAVDVFADLAPFFFGDFLAVGLAAFFFLAIAKYSFTSKRPSHGGRRSRGRYRTGERPRRCELLSAATRHAWFAGALFRVSPNQVKANPRFKLTSVLTRPARPCQNGGLSATHMLDDESTQRVESGEIEPPSLL